MSDLNLLDLKMAALSGHIMLGRFKQDKRNKGLYIAYERPHKVDFTEKTLIAALEWCLKYGPFEYVCCVDSGKSYRMKVEEMTPDEVKAFRENLSGRTEDEGQ